MFHCSDFVPGGANCGIEILRLSMLKLAELLAAKNMKLPMHMCLQFDNCGENKNRTTFGYLSLLVELGLFKRINVSFLIVGHTHCLIDQWFSTITKIIKRQRFIGTPLAMENLLYQYQGKKSTFKNPEKQQHVHAVYNIRAMLEPYINENIKWFQVC